MNTANKASCGCLDAYLRVHADDKMMLNAGGGKVLDWKESTVLLRCVNLEPWLDQDPY
jgi:hypothetical protein